MNLWHSLLPYNHNANSISAETEALSLVANYYYQLLYNIFDWGVFKHKITQNGFSIITHYSFVVALFSCHTSFHNKTHLLENYSSLLLPPAPMPGVWASLSASLPLWGGGRRISPNSDAWRNITLALSAMHRRVITMLMLVGIRGLLGERWNGNLCQSKLKCRVVVGMMMDWRSFSLKLYQHSMNYDSYVVIQCSICM